MSSPTTSPTLLPTENSTQTSPTELPTLAPSVLVVQTSPSESPTPLPSFTFGPTSLPTSEPTLSFKPTPRPTVTVQPTLSTNPTLVPTLSPTFSQLPTITPQPSLTPTPAPTVFCDAFPGAIGCWPDASWRFAAGIFALSYLFLLGLLVLVGIAGRIIKKRREKLALKKARGGISRVASEMDLMGLADGGALGQLEMMDEIVLDYGESEVEYATLQDGPTGLGIRYKPGIGIITQVISPKKQADVEGMTRGCKIISMNGQSLKLSVDDKRFTDLLVSLNRPIVLGYLRPNGQAALMAKEVHMGGKVADNKYEYRDDEDDTEIEVKASPVKRWSISQGQVTARAFLEVECGVEAALLDCIETVFEGQGVIMNAASLCDTVILEDSILLDLGLSKIQLRVFRRATARLLEAVDDGRIVDAQGVPRKISGAQAVFGNAAYSPPMQAQAALMQAQTAAPGHNRMAKSAATNLFASFSGPAAPSSGTADNIELQSSKSTTNIEAGVAQKQGLKEGPCELLLDNQVKENLHAIWDPNSSTLTIRDANEAVVIEYIVKTGSAIDGGELEAHSRKLKVQFETTSGGVGTVIFNHDDVASWLAVFNGQILGSTGTTGSDNLTPVVPEADLPYGGNLSAARRAQDRGAIRRLMAHQQSLKQRPTTTTVSAGTPGSPAETSEAAADVGKNKDVKSAGQVRGPRLSKASTKSNSGSEGDSDTEFAEASPTTGAKSSPRKSSNPQDSRSRTRQPSVKASSVSRSRKPIKPSVRHSERPSATPDEVDASDNKLARRPSTVEPPTTIQEFVERSCKLKAMRGSLVLTKLKAEGVKDFSGLGALRSKYENEEAFTSFLKRDLGLELDEARKFVNGLGALPKEVLLPVDVEVAAPDTSPILRRSTGDAAPRKPKVRLSSTN